jgi:subtilisin family serine protease
MILPWYDPRPWIGRTKRIRRIFHLKESCDPEDVCRDLYRFGGRPVRVLRHLGMVVGEFVHDEKAIGLLEGHPYVLHWEPDLRVTITEPYAGKISDRSTPSIPWGVRQVEANKVWSMTRGKAVKVAVIDTGIDYDHPAVKSNYRGGVNILSPLLSPYDYNGHGTHVAGTIAGCAVESGLIGVAPRAYIYAVKAFNRKGTANLSDLLSAINWCIENKMQVVNMSFGMEKMSESLRRAIYKAYRKGIVMLAAAGNKGIYGKVDFPARYPETIAVTATDKRGQIAAFSNHSRDVDVAAPGEKIPSSWTNGGTREMSGTSMAVPHVVGTVALLLYLRPDLTPEQIRRILTASSVPVAGAGVGRVNAFRSVQMLMHARI